MTLTPFYTVMALGMSITALVCWTATKIAWKKGDVGAVSVFAMAFLVTAISTAWATKAAWTEINGRQVTTRDRFEAESEMILKPGSTNAEGVSAPVAQIDRP